jgi:hypothetical protein
VLAAILQATVALLLVVVVKWGVGFEHSARLFGRIAQEFPPSGLLSFWHFAFPLFFLFSSVVFA